MDKKKSKLYSFLSAICGIAAFVIVVSFLSCLREEQSNQYYNTHAYCENCYEELHTDNLIAFADGNGYMCSDCLHKHHDEYSLCNGCGYVIFTEDAYLNAYCNECADKQN